MMRFFGLIAVLVWTFALNAASDPNVIMGVVEDQSGAVIQDAQVTLGSDTGQKVAAVVTDEEGQFEFLNVAADHYLMEVSAPGLTTKRVAVDVGNGPVASLTIKLEIAGGAQRVTVTSTAEPGLAPLVGENESRMSVSQGELQMLPTEGDDVTAVSSLFVQPAANGALGTSIVVDGVETKATDLPAASILEMRVNQDPYGAEFERPGTGRIEVTTRKGSYHHYHGLVSELYRNSALDARNAFATEKAPLHRSVTEAQAGGPIARHISFFVAGRHYSDHETAVINAVTPTGPLVQNFGTPERNDYAYGRLDFALSPSHNLSVAYKYKDKWKQNRNVGGFDLPERAVNVFDRESELKVFEDAILSSRLLNDFRVTYLEEPLGMDSLVNRPAILVPGAFKDGGAQSTAHQKERTANVQDVMTFFKGAHTIRFGGGIRPRWFDAFNATNFGGTFSFASLANYEAGRPYLFTINQGNPAVPYTQQEYFGFVDDAIKVSQRLSLSAGIRYEGQSNLPDHNNFAPRIALAYAAGKNVIRAGAGVFYDRQPDVFQQQALLYNGQRIRQIVLENPLYPVPSLRNLPYAAPSVVRIAPNIQSPYLFQANMAVEHRFNERNLLTIDYTYLRGLKLYRTRNLNAPLPPTGQRPDPNYINIDQFESSGQSRANLLTVTYQATVRSRFNAYVQYTLSRSNDDTSGFMFLPANNYDLRSEWGRSDLDRRHQFKLLGFDELPFGFDAGAIANLSSGIPSNVTTGFDNNHDTVANDRPPGVGRNTGRGPGYASIDLHLAKNFRLQGESSKPKIAIGLDAFNVFNTANYKSFVGVMTSPYFGYANSAYPARELQVSLLLKF